MATKAHLEGNKRYLEKLDQIMIRPSKERGTEIRAAAALAGQSVQAYILQAVAERMERDAEGCESSQDNI